MMRKIYLIRIIKPVRSFAAWHPAIFLALLQVGGVLSIDLLLLVGGQVSEHVALGDLAGHGDPMINVALVIRIDL